MKQGPVRKVEKTEMLAAETGLQLPDFVLI